MTVGEGNSRGPVAADEDARGWRHGGVGGDGGGRNSGGRRGLGGRGCGGLREVRRH